MATHEALPLTPLSTAILLALSAEPLHGYGLMQAVSAQSDGILTPGTGTLYAALVRMLEAGLIEEAAEAAPDDGRRGRSYRLSSDGQALLQAETARMDRVVSLARQRGLGPDGSLATEGGA
jgi:DNA-binding PadR family transcriptional regulator